MSINLTGPFAASKGEIIEALKNKEIKYTFSDMFFRIKNILARCGLPTQVFKIDIPEGHIYVSRQQFLKFYQHYKQTNINFYPEVDRSTHASVDNAFDISSAINNNDIIINDKKKEDNVKKWLEQVKEFSKDKLNAIVKEKLEHLSDKVEKRQIISRKQLETAIKKIENMTKKASYITMASVMDENKLQKLRDIVEKRSAQ